MPQILSVLDGDTFAVSDLSGNIDRHEVHGLFSRDTRFLCHFKLKINESDPTLLTSHEVDHYSAAFFLTNPQLDGLDPGRISIIRHRFVGEGMHEDITVINHADEAVRVRLSLEIANDFADLFEVKECCINEKAGLIRSEFDAEQGAIVLTYRHDDFVRGTKVLFTEPYEWRDDEGIALFDFELAPKQGWKTCAEVSIFEQEAETEPTYGCDAFFIGSAEIEGQIKKWRNDVPWLATDWDDLMHVYWQSVDDLAALRLKVGAADNPHNLLAAGLPWFMTIFGRDTLLTAYESIALGPTLARGALEALAEYQGRKVDDFKEEQPGKILHEIRFGELAMRGQVPHHPYYGTVDATELFIILASEVFRWTGDRNFLERLRGPLLAADAWIGDHGDVDGDGYVEYKRISPKGLDNQGWKDSGDSIRFSDGRLAAPPIALCEVQGYVYDAKLRLAEIAQEVWGDPMLAQRLRAEAAELKERFNRDFWIEERGGYFALALDGGKRKVDSVTSNIGQLLWSGIVDEDKSRAIRDRLMDKSMLSRWGVRTMSTEDAGFSPIAYHNGTVWPHDNALIAAGLRRYGFADEANTIISSIVLASRHFNYRLPEVFAGYPASQSLFPVEYPTASSPQAWAAASPILFVTTMLGLSPDQKDSKPQLHPVLPKQCNEIVLTGLPFRGSYYDLRADRTGWSAEESSPAAARSSLR